MAVAAREKPVLIALDTNVLIDRALEDGEVIEAIETLRKKFPHAQIVVTRTVLAELAWGADNFEAQNIREACETALACLRDWGFQALDVIPIGMRIVDEISRKLRSRGVLPDEEENDASIIAEAALIGCKILLTSDRHFLDAQANPLLAKILEDAHVSVVNIVPHFEVVKIIPPRLISRIYGGR